MNTAKILHDQAMEYYDLARIAKAKGNQRTHDDYMLKALVMEKEAAFKLPKQSTKSFWPYAYFRSAAWMSFHLNQMKEAVTLIQFALAGNPSDFERGRLNEILEAVKQKDPTALLFNTSTENQIFSGFLVSIDLSQKIATLQINEKPEYQYFNLPEGLSLTPLFLGQLVLVHAKQIDKGKNIIQEIKLAA